MAKPLPPLSVDILHEVENIEGQLQTYLSRCKEPESSLDSPPQFNVEKATRIVRSLGVRAFEVQADYYVSLDDSCSEWIDDVGSSTIRSCMGIARKFATADQLPQLEWELLQTLRDYVERYKQKLKVIALPLIQPEVVPKSNRALVETFIQKMLDAGCPVRRTDIWMTAGYKDATEFQRFQRDDPRTNPTARRKFQELLNLSTDAFKERRRKNRAE